MRKISSDDTNKEGHFYKTHWIWLIAYIGIGFVISFILPFPISFFVALLIFFSLNAVRADIALRKQGVDGIKGLYKSMSSSFGAGNNRIYGYSPIKFYCMKCGYEHRKDVCPKCGSKAVRVG